MAKQDNMDIDFITVPAEQADFPDNSFDVITACQCFGILTMKRLFQTLPAC